MRTDAWYMLIAALVVFMLAAHLPGMAAAHCDTLDGPVVTTAKKAFETGDVTPVLKWVKKDDEAEIRQAFRKALSVRKQGGEGKELAENYFFEALVRVHRAGEGAPYTGLKQGPAAPVILATDTALEKGSADALLKIMTEAVTAGIKERFARAEETKKRADESIEAGRSFVAAYVELTHYIERLHADAAVRGAHHNGQEKDAAGEHHHQH